MKYRKRSDMSKNVFGIMGPQVGKIGTVVGYVANGQVVYRAYKRHISNPQTPAQQAHRFKMKTLSQASKDLEWMVGYGLKEAGMEIGTTARNAFIKVNMPNFVTEPELALDYDRLIVAQGRMSGVVITNEGPVGEGFGYRLCFTQEAPGANRPTDMVVAVLWCPDLRETVYVNGFPTAGTFATEVALQESWRGHDIHVYAAMVNTLNEPASLKSRSQDGDSLLMPHETSNTAHLMIASDN